MHQISGSQISGLFESRIPEIRLDNQSFFIYPIPGRMPYVTSRISDCQKDRISGQIGRYVFLGKGQKFPN